LKDLFTSFFLVMFIGNKALELKRDCCWNLGNESFKKWWRVIPVSKNMHFSYRIVWSYDTLSYLNLWRDKFHLHDTLSRWCMLQYLDFDGEYFWWKKIFYKIFFENFCKKIWAIWLLCKTNYELHHSIRLSIGHIIIM